MSEVKGLANISPQKELGAVCTADLPPDVRRFVDRVPQILVMMNKAGNILNQFGFIDVTNASVTNLETTNVYTTNVQTTNVYSTNILAVTIYDITQTTSITINSTTVTINNNLTVNGTFTASGTLSLANLDFSFVSSIQYDSATNKLQLKKTTVTNGVVGSEDANWTDIMTAATKDVVVDTAYDTGTGVFTETKATLTVFEAGSNDGGTTVFTAEAC